MMDSYVGRIAAHLGRMSYDCAPAEVCERVRTALLYNLSMALGGHGANGHLEALHKTVHATPGHATVIGENIGRAPADAAFLNAALIAARGQNDTYPELVAHVGCVVIPAALCAAETTDCSGAEFLTALLRGYEAVARIGAGAADEVNRRGFRATSVFSVFGAAAASASVLRLTAEETASALAIAANFAGGIKQCWADGSDEWLLQVANASRLGYLATLYASAGIKGAPLALEGESGFLRAVCGEVPPLDLQGWPILDLAFKPYPGCAFNQAPVHVLRQMLDTQATDRDNFHRIRVFMNPADAAYPGVAARGPFASESGAIMSAPFMLAATLADGAPALSHFSQRRADERLTRLSHTIEVEADSAIARWHCRIAIEMAAGQYVEMATGDEELFRFSWDEAQRVLTSVAADWGGSNQERRFHELVKEVGNLDRQPGLDALIAVIRHGASPPRPA